MINFQFFCLGGQNEKGKCCQILNVDDDIYILSCGIITPPSIVSGIQKKIPNFDYLVENKERVKGIFIGTSEYKQFGGLEYLVDVLPNVPIYTSPIGKVLITSFFKNDILNKKSNDFVPNIVALEPLKSVMIDGKMQVTTFRTYNYFLFGIGFVFTFGQKSIIYFDKFIVPTSMNNFFNDLIFEINKITKNNNYLLLTSVGKNINYPSFATPNYGIKDFFDNIFSNEKNQIIIALDANNLYYLAVIAKLCTGYSLPFCLIDQTTNDVFSYLVKNKIINLPNLPWVDPQLIKNYKHCVVIIVAYRQKLIQKLEKIISGDDQNIQFHDEDAFVYALDTENGFEKIESNIIDEISKLQKVTTYRLPKDIIELSQCQEDHKFIVSLLRPRYIIPINDLYMNFVKYEQLIATTKFKSNNVLLIDNGQIVKFVNDQIEKIPVKKSNIKITEQNIRSHGYIDIHASHLIESQQMASDGCVLISLLIDRQAKKIIKFNYNPVGVINLLNEKNKQKLVEINTILNDRMNEILAKFVDQNNLLTKKLQDEFKKEVIKLYQKNFGKKPLILITIIYNNSVIQQKKIEYENR